MALTTSKLSDPLASKFFRSMQNIEAINSRLAFPHEATLTLCQLEAVLNKFDSELAYATLHSDLTEKYNLNKEYYNLIEEIRVDLIANGVPDQGKEALVKKLDAVVSSLEKDFSIFAEEKYRLLDEIFLIKTNSHLEFDLIELRSRTELLLSNPNRVYGIELTKIAHIHAVLETEENRLAALKKHFQNRPKIYI